MSDCGCVSADRAVHVEQYRPTDLIPGTVIPLYFISRLRDVWRTIAVGSKSALDRCYIVRQDGSDFPKPASQPADTAVRSAYSERVIEVSVERPFCSEIKGPLLIIPGYSENASDAVRWLAGANTTLFNSTLRINQPWLELEFYRKAPLLVPTKRAPMDLVERWPNFGTAGGITTETVLFPGWGRRMTGVSLRMAGRTAGDFVWSFSGIDQADHDSLGSIIHEHVLQPPTTQAVDFAQKFFFTGEFDYYEFSIAEGTALNAGVTVSLIIKAHD